MFSLCFEWSAFVTVRPSRAGAVRVIDVRRVGGDVFFDNGRRYVAAVEPLVLPDAWGGFALPAFYICPMCAQLALLRGAAWDFDGGRLLIDGAVLMGRAGGVFAFSSMETAARWVQINKDRAAAELSTIAAMTVGEEVAWRAGRAGLLQVYAAQVVGRAASVADADKRAALVAESNYALLKWGAA